MDNVKDILRTCHAHKCKNIFTCSPYSNRRYCTACQSKLTRIKNRMLKRTTNKRSHK